MQTVLQASFQILWSILFVMALEFVALGYFLRGLPFFKHLGRDLLLLAAATAIPVWMKIFPHPVSAGSMGDWILTAVFSLFVCAFLGSTIQTARHTSGFSPERFSWNWMLATGLWAAWMIENIFANRVGGRGRFPLELYLAFAVTFVWLLIFMRAKKDRIQPQKETSRLGVFLGRVYFAPATASLAAMAVAFSDVELSQSIWVGGLLVYGALGVYLFADHLAGMYAEQEDLLLKTAETDLAMDEEKPLQELGRNTAQVSREIRGFTSQLQQFSHGVLAGRNQESASLERVERARQNLERYTQGILDYAASFTVKLDSPENVLPWIRNELEAACGALGLRLELKFDIESVNAGIDKAFLGKVVRQICANAKEAGAASLELRARAVGTKILLAFEDDGEGIDGALLDQLKTPFFTTKKNQGACGLGLSMAETILQGHGGALEVNAGNGMNGKPGFMVAMVLPLTGAGHAA